MGNQACCETANNRKNNNFVAPSNYNISNTQRNTLNPPNYRTKTNQTNKLNQPYVPNIPEKQNDNNFETTNFEEQEEKNSNYNFGKQSIKLGDSVKNSNSGVNLSPVSSVKNRFKPFGMKNRIEYAHDEIIVCMIELENKKIATGSYDNTIKIWNLKSSNIKCDKTIKEDGKVFSLLEFEQDMLLCAIDQSPDDIDDINQVDKNDIMINLWNLNSTEKIIYSFKGHDLRINCLVKCNDKFFASCSNDGNIIIWDYVLKKNVKTLSGHNDCILCMILLNDGKLCSGSADYTIKIWNWEKGILICNLTGNTNWVKCLCELNNGFIISGSHDNLIKVWDNNYRFITTLEGHSRSVRSICQIANTNYIASASFDHTIKIWDLNTYECIQTLKGHTSSVINVIYHSDGYLVSSSNDKSIQIYKNI